MKLPLSFKSILWSFDFSQLSLVEDKRLIILSTINYGDFKHWQWIVQFYGKKEVGKVISEVPVGHIRKRARILASIIFGTHDVGSKKKKY